MRLTSACFVLAGAALVLGCRGGGSGDDDPVDARIDGDVDPDDATIYQIQGGTLEGQRVSVRGVIVTAIDAFGDRRGNFWIQEPDGGAYSGVLVFGAPLDQVAALRVGDVVDVENVVVVEFALDTDTSGRTTTELVRPDGGQISVTKVDDGAAPAPEVVDALAIGRLPTAAARDAEWEKWEGVLIRLENVTRLTGLRTIGDDPTFVEFQVTGPLRVDSSLGEITTDAIGPANNCFASITGIGDYFFNYKLLPRSTDEIVSGGTDCPAPETGDEACDDGVDNDANGYADCDDFGCRDAEVCQENPTIAQIQMGTIPVNTTVNLSGVYVTAVDTIGSSQGFWAADALQGAPYSGIYVFTGPSVPDGIAIGATVDVVGRYIEFDVMPPAGDTLSEIDARAGSGGSVTVASPPGETLPSPLTGVAPSTLAESGAVGAPYESVLVRIGPARVMSLPGNDRLLLNTAGGTIVADDDAFNYSQVSYPVGTCFETVTGVMGINLFDDQRRLFPRLSADLAEAADPATCAGL